MKKELEYILFILFPGILFSIIGIFLGAINHENLYCACGFCSITVYKSGFYTGLIGLSIGMLLGAILYLVLGKNMKKKIFRLLKK